MIYTKQQLIQAFCEAQQCTVQDLPDIEARMQDTLNMERNRLVTQATRTQESLDKLPTTAKERMKRMAITYLNSKVAEQTLADNASVSL